MLKQDSNFLLLNFTEVASVRNESDRVCDYSLNDVEYLSPKANIRALQNVVQFADISRPCFRSSHIRSKLVVIQQPTRYLILHITPRAFHFTRITLPFLVRTPALEE
jgi:hypothetical protein